MKSMNLLFFGWDSGPAQPWYRNMNTAGVFTRYIEGQITVLLGVEAELLSAVTVSYNSADKRLTLTLKIPVIKT